ncbi:hypothetical protein Emin_0207 [Elusimicrobium minutum Pei191]|uniref:Uncharacterized protein n=1 Tax=Elusimicrobium minutum (strain Pei191) TaxID=445932 RepID=B2KB11_ELUMP|nr:hypothetical protein [Elusimicrobium minutum]ACC97770.1 hypothetical protein Emin_0207 [Elusimicrobium minutum Pei191]
MKKSREEIAEMEPEEYDNYLKNLTEEDREEENIIRAKEDAEFDLEVERIKISGQYKFDHEKINKMSEAESRAFLKKLSSEDLSLYTKEFIALSNERTEKVPQSFKFHIVISIILGAVVVWFLGGPALEAFTSLETVPKIVFILIISALILPALWAYFREKKIEKICRKCGFSLVKDDYAKYKMKNELQDIAVFRNRPRNILRREITIATSKMVSLNITGKRAYMLEVCYEWDLGRFSGEKKAQAIVLEAREAQPYIKIAPKPKFFTILKFFYKPLNKNFNGISVHKRYKLYCAPEYEQRALDSLMRVLPRIEKGNFVVEICGKWITVIKFSNTSNFDKFVASALPIAENFDTDRNYR